MGEDWPDWFKTAKIAVPPYVCVQYGYVVVTLFAEMC